jgi:hypothetical protein
MTEDKRVVLLVCGNGALANAILALDDGKSIFTLKFSTESGVLKNTGTWEGNIVAVHCGTGRQLSDLLTFCEKVEVPLIQASTGQVLPSMIKIPIIDAPNLDPTTIAFLKALPGLLKEMTRDPAVSIAGGYTIESHKPEKKSPPGTTLMMAKLAGLPSTSVESVRTPGIQLALGISRRHFGQHSINRITLEFSSGALFTQEIRIEGIEPYAKGAVILAQRILERKAQIGLAPILYKMTEFYC